MLYLRQGGAQATEHLIFGALEVGELFKKAVRFGARLVDVQVHADAVFGGTLDQTAKRFQSAGTRGGVLRVIVPRIGGELAE